MARPASAIVLESDSASSPSPRSEEHTSELQSRLHLVCRLLLEKKTRFRLRRQSERPCRRHRQRNGNARITPDLSDELSGSEHRIGLRSLPYMFPKEAHKLPSYA